MNKNMIKYDKNRIKCDKWMRKCDKGNEIGWNIKKDENKVNLYE